MTQAVLIRNADLYAPEHVGMRDILIAGGKIIAVEPHLENVNIPGMETVDAAGRRVTPGRIWRSWMPAARFSRRAFLISTFTSRAAAARAVGQAAAQSSISPPWSKAV